MQGTLRGRTALVTGATAGLGAAVARELSARGANIVLHYAFPHLHDETASVGASLPTEWISVCADLSTIQGPKDLVAATVERFAHIDILVHNAAHFVSGPTESITDEQWDAAFAVNTRAPFLLTQAALPHLTPFTPQDPPPLSAGQGGARIICMSSGTCRAPHRQPGALCYAATKGALETMIKVWAQELAPVYGCTVNGVSPGPTNTEMMQRATGGNLQLINDHYGKVTPSEGAMGEPQDVALAVAYLAEPSTKAALLPTRGVSGRPASALNVEELNL